MVADSLLYARFPLVAGKVAYLPMARKRKKNIRSRPGALAPASAATRARMPFTRGSEDRQEMDSPSLINAGWIMVEAGGF